MAQKEIRKVIIFGTGGNCVDILDTLDEINRIRPTFECIGFLDDDTARQGTVVAGRKVLGPLANARAFPDVYFINGIGSTRNFHKKEHIIRSAGIPLERFVSIIHPTASVSRLARIGLGTIIFQNVTVTSHATVGNHVIILPNSVISHDDVIGDYTCIAGGVCISGKVVIEPSCYLGSNCSVIENVRIGRNSLIGMGAVVTRDVGNNSVMVGNPARFIRTSVNSD
jgi:sugar O-acyltransferase (sialic acid O-acetyltransferase NeuD family)